MNIELQCCGLFMLFVLLGLFLSDKSLSLTSRRLFFRTLISCIGCLALDILSIVAIHESVYGTLPSAVTEAICKLYIMSLLVQGYAGFLYAANEFFANNARLRLRNAYRVLLFVGCAGVALLPIRYFMEGRVVYSYGPAVYFAYLVAVVLICSTIYMAFRGTKRASRRRRRAILMWQGSLLLAAVIQFMRPELLLAGFAVAFGLSVTYAELENPHEGIDRMTGQFTANALLTYLDDLYRNGKPFSALYVRVEYRTQNVDPETEKEAMLRVANFLERDKDAFVFRRSDDEYVLLYETEQQMRAGYEQACKGAASTDLPMRLWYLLVPDGTLMNSVDEFMRFNHYFEVNASGQECVTVDQAAVDQMRGFFQTQKMIAAALEEGRVEVFYQPIYNVAEKRFTSAEALVRIRNADGSLVMPGAFIPVAEENGQIIALGSEVLRQVCCFLATGEAQKLGLEYIEVNLSVAQFDENDPANLVQNALERYGVSPSELNLEITETASNSAKRVLLTNMNKLIKQGVHFSLDDFGTGRSNLDYFVDMPVNIVKFDYSFTQGYFQGGKAHYVVESVVGLMDRMGMSIVAEGVETEEQFKAMCDLGISYIQGFYFSRPIPRDELLAFLREQNPDE